MDTLLPSLQILDIANCQQVESFPVGGKRNAFLRRTSTNEIKSHFTICSRRHKRLGQTHARRAVNKTIAKEEGKIVLKHWSHLLHKKGCPNPNQGIF
nr:hypothetical protein CFP56_55284 [Quercus suber]